MKLKKYITKKNLITSSLLAVVGFSGARLIAYSADPKTEFGCAAATESVQETNTILETIASFIWSQFGGTINDASCIGETKIHGIVNVTSENEVREVLVYAAEQGLAVSIAGVRHSMGGHTAQENGLVIDIRGLNNIELHEESQTVTVGSGVTWHDLQNVIHPRYAVSAMQSTDIFTVGGSISVNAHGMDHQIGAVENTIRRLIIMLPDGTVTQVSRTENTELYDAVVGGYGLFGIILEAELDVVPNDIYQSKRTIMAFADFPRYYDEQIANNPDIGLMYTHLSVAPTSLLDEALVYEYEKQDVAVPLSEIPPLTEIGSVKLRRTLMNLSKTGPIAQQLRWWAEKHLEHRFESCSITRNQAIGSGEACFVSRNEPMHDSVPYLYNNLTKETDILHEYFIPRENIVAYVNDLRVLVKERKINMLNASVRVVNKERGLLTYAPEEAFSIVLFINQPITEKGNEKMRADTKALIDLTHRHGGTFFLPYQTYYTAEQLRTSYPNLDAFLDLKKKYDPEQRIQSRFYDYLLQAQKS